MKKEQEQIATNTSSGTEKVERIKKETQKAGGKSVTAKRTRTTTVKETAKGEAALGAPEEKKQTISAKKVNAKQSGSPAEKESEKAKKRVELALKKKEEKEKRKAEKAAAIAKKKEEKKKRIAEKKAQIAKRNAAKKAEIEKRAAEKKAQAEKRASEKQARVRARAQQKNKGKKTEKAKRQTRKENHDERKSYGGWLAAVVTLGVVSLALGATVTVETIEMQRAANATMASYRATMYELTSIMEHVDDDLDRVRLSDSPAQQSRILTDLLVQARMAELDLEKLPIDGESDRNVTSFINRTGMECERMLSILRNGGELSERDRARLEELYQINHAIRTELDSLMAKMTDKDMKAFIEEGKGSISDSIGKMEKLTLEENRAAFERDTSGAGTKRNAPKDGKEAEIPAIDPAQAEELCKGYFKSYNISDYQCVGETIGHSYTAYNVQGYDDKGSMLFAEVSKTDGALLRFDYYEECKGETFDIENAEKIAEEFLESLGYDDMEAVRLRHNGSTTDFTFVYEDDDVVYYPDEIHVKVCRTRGVVSGMDATKYIHNHKERAEVETKLTLADAYDKLYDGLIVEASRLAVVQTVRGERPAYEFLCSYENEYYFVYLDANNGEEIAIINTRNI